MSKSKLTSKAGFSFEDLSAMVKTENFSFVAKSLPSFLTPILQQKEKDLDTSKKEAEKLKKESEKLKKQKSYYKKQEELSSKKREHEKTTKDIQNSYNESYNEEYSDVVIKASREVLEQIEKLMEESPELALDLYTNITIFSRKYLKQNFPKVIATLDNKYLPQLLERLLKLDWSSEQEQKKENRLRKLDDYMLILAVVQKEENEKQLERHLTQLKDEAEIIKKDNYTEVIPESHRNRIAEAEKEYATSLAGDLNYVRENFLHTPYELLEKAAAVGNIDLFLQANQYEINSDHAKIKILTAAVENLRVEFLERFFKELKPQHYRSSYMDPLCIALKKKVSGTDVEKKADCIKAMISAMSEKDFTPERSYIYFESAIDAGDFTALQLMVERSAKSLQERNPLEYALSKGASLQILEYLIKQNPKLLSSKGFNPIEMAASLGNLGFLELLQRSDIKDLLAQHDIKLVAKASMLVSAARQGSASVCQYFLDNFPHLAQEKVETTLESLESDCYSYRADIEINALEAAAYKLAMRNQLKSSITAEKFLETFKVLAQSKAPLDLTLLGNNILHEALTNLDNEAAVEIAKFYPELILERNSDNSNVLHRCAYEGNADLFKTLLESINKDDASQLDYYLNRDGNILHNAVKGLLYNYPYNSDASKYHEICLLCVTKFPATAFVEVNGETPFQLALNLADATLAIILLKNIPQEEYFKHMINPLSQTLEKRNSSRNRETPQNILDFFRNPENSQLYLRLLQKPDQTGRTPIQYAAIFGDMDILEDCVRHNLDFDLVDREGKNLLHLAIAHNNTEVASFLAKNYPKLTTMVDKDGMSPSDYALIDAITNKSSSLLEILPVQTSKSVAFSRPIPRSFLGTLTHAENDNIAQIAARNRSYKILCDILRENPALANTLTEAPLDILLSDIPKQKSKDYPFFLEAISLTFNSNANIPTARLSEIIQSMPDDFGLDIVIIILQKYPGIFTQDPEEFLKIAPTLFKLEAKLEAEGSPENKATQVINLIFSQDDGALLNVARNDRSCLIRYLNANPEILKEKVMADTINSLLEDEDVVMIEMMADKCSEIIRILNAEQLEIIFKYLVKQKNDAAAQNIFANADPKQLKIFLDAHVSELIADSAKNEMYGLYCDIAKSYNQFVDPDTHKLLKEIAFEFAANYEGNDDFKCPISMGIITGPAVLVKVKSSISEKKVMQAGKPRYYDLEAFDLFITTNLPGTTLVDPLVDPLYRQPVDLEESKVDEDFPKKLAAQRSLVQLCLAFIDNMVAEDKDNWVSKILEGVKELFPNKEKMLDEANQKFNLAKELKSKQQPDDGISVRGVNKATTTKPKQLYDIRITTSIEKTSSQKDPEKPKGETYITSITHTQKQSERIAA